MQVADDEAILRADASPAASRILIVAEAGGGKSTTLATTVERLGARRIGDWRGKSHRRLLVSINDTTDPRGFTYISNNSGRARCNGERTLVDVGNGSEGRRRHLTEAEVSHVGGRRAYSKRVPTAVAQPVPTTWSLASRIAITDRDAN